MINDEFFTVETMITLTGATTCTLVVANTIQSVFNFNPKWLALFIAQLISIAGVYFTNGAGSDYFIGIINGCLIYCTATGATQIAGSPGEKPTGRGKLLVPRTAEQAKQPQYESGRRHFFSSWF